MLSMHAVFHDTDPFWNKSHGIERFHVLILVTHGKVHYEFPDEKVILQRGDFMLLPIGTERLAHNDRSDLPQKYTALFEVDPQVDEFPLLKKNSRSLVNVRTFELIKQRFSMLHQQWLSKQPYHELLCKSIVTELLVWLERELRDTLKSNRKLHLIRRLEEYIVSHYREPFTVEELASHIDRSQSYTVFLFREATGMTPIEYMHLVRTTSANDLLMNTSMSVSEVADYLGYCDASYFNKIFKKYTGSLPSSIVKNRILHAEK